MARHRRFNRYEIARRTRFPLNRIDCFCITKLVWALSCDYKTLFDTDTRFKLRCERFWITDNSLHWKIKRKHTSWILWMTFVFVMFSSQHFWWKIMCIRKTGGSALIFGRNINRFSIGIASGSQVFPKYKWSRHSTLSRWHRQWIDLSNE